MYGYYLLLTFLCNVLCVQCISNITFDSFQNLTGDNGLWVNILRDCKEPTVGCLKRTVYDFLKNTLEYPGDVQFTDFIKFSRNAIDYNVTDKYFVNSSNLTNETIKDDTPLEEISRSLTSDTTKFLMTHDLEVQLPGSFFLDSTVKISPRSFDSSSALVKLQVTPRDMKAFAGTGRLFKKLRKFITERLLWALLAILLVIKLLAVKLLFVLPALLGVAAAKKLILNILLFFFPFLHHLFKLCAYTPYGSKHHIHKHQISHIHEIAHAPYKHHKHHNPHHGEIEVIGPHADGPPHHLDDFDHHEHYGFGDEGYPSIDPHYPNEVINRNGGEEEEEDSGFQWPWSPAKQKRKKKLRKRPPGSGRPPGASQIENILKQAEREAVIKTKLQKERQRIREENLRLQEQLNNALIMQEKLKQHAVLINGKLPNNHQQFLAPPLSAASTHLTPQVLANLKPQFTSPNRFTGQFIESPNQPSKQSGPFAEPPSQSSNLSGKFAEPPIQFSQQPGQYSQQASTFTKPAGAFVQQAVPFAQPSANQFVQPSTQFVKPAGQFSQAPIQFAQPPATFESPVKATQIQKSPAITSNSPNRFTGSKFAEQSIHNAPSKTAQLAINYLKQQENLKKYQLNGPITIDRTFIDDQLPENKQNNQIQKSEPPKAISTTEHALPQVSKSIFVTPSIEEEIYNAASITYDPFYSPILEKIDTILVGLGFKEEPCKERLICSMYKKPLEFTPHSNLLSVELSRDSKELQKPSITNAAVVRFYRYVQSARDGQDQRDCLRLYPSCVINTDLGL